MEIVLEYCHFVAMSDESGSFNMLNIIVLSSETSVIVGKIESIRPPCPTLPQQSTVPSLGNELLFQVVGKICIRATVPFKAEII